MRKIKGVFFDLGGTLRICQEVPAHQEKAKARMAELAGLGLFLMPGVLLADAQRPPQVKKHAPDLLHISSPHQKSEYVSLRPWAGTGPAAPE